MDTRSRTKGAAKALPTVAPPKAENAPATPATPVPPTIKFADEAPIETIGSRLRKRRRTGSSTAEGPSPAKRPNLNKGIEQPASTVEPTSQPKQVEPNVERAIDTERPQEPQTVVPLLNSDEKEVEAVERIEPAVEPEADTQGDPEAEPEEEALDREESTEQQVSEAQIWAAALATRAGLPNFVDGQDGASGDGVYENGMDLDGTSNWLSVDASLQLKVQSLPILDNLATQILSTLAKGTYQDTLSTVTEPDSVSAQAYATLKDLFDHTKKVYSSDEPFLSAYELNLHESSHHDTLRKANLATFVSSVYGSQNVGFYHLNEHFLETFVPDGGRLLKSQGGLYLELKTQSYISAMSNGERSRAEILEDLFPEDLEVRLLARRPGAKQLAPSEADFVKRARSRRDHLIAEPDTEDAIESLPDKYVWEDFLRDVNGYVSKNFEAIVAPQQLRKPTRGRPSAYSMGEYAMEPTDQQPGFEDQGHLRPQNDVQAADQDHSHQDIVEKAARAAQIALQGDFYGNNLEEQQMIQPDRRPSEAEQLLDGQLDGADQPSQSFGDAAAIPFPSQTAPTQVLYERARLAATAKASPNNRRAGLPSQRRPWTTEEENALMAGLDRVKGPHWSQILAMFGPGGNINESLKDRNQVQLKDKARNLKLFFLKSGIEVPYYLQFVTGELKTRAPAQAAKNEARERAKMRGDEDKAHVEGIMALAGGARTDSTENGVDGDDAIIVAATKQAAQGIMEQERELNYEERLAQTLLDQAE
ncbi:MAG: TTAGGG repeat binding factor [Pycnora praestabilis]|nr:MAG: TTAGGG repeat binding factor [Pycnora praestabilis]